MDERWRRLNELFDRLVDARPEVRDEALRAVDDVRLGRRLHAMLRAHDESAERARGVVDRALEAFAVDGLPLEVEPSDGDRVGPYSLVRPVGHGGMGTVYLAERADDAYASKVAVKVIRSSAAGPDALRRFRAERQILADLSHPGIARLLDGGETDDGAPYLVMEYVDGIPIDRYCEERDLSVTERLRLFRKVCDAVQFAHARLVVHRDLKPANVLVGDDGEPHLLDFGIAKLLEGGATPDDAGLTRTGLRPMTPTYASPEQVRGEAISTASDVYALGVLLYLLLTGELPYPGWNTPRELEDAILNDEAAPPSTIRGGTSTPGSSSTGRRDRVGTDLDTIVLKAMSKEVARRYETVDQLSEDLRRYLEGLPVRARPDTFTYRANKFIRRNRGAVLGGVTTSLAILAFAVSSAVQAYRLEAERDAAEAARAEAEAVTDFLVGVFDATDPDVAQGLDLTARDILGHGGRRVRTELADEPVVQSAVMAAIGVAYERLGAYDSANALLAQAADLARDHAGSHSEAYLHRLLDLGGTYRQLGDMEQADSTFRRALDIAIATFGPDATETSTAWNDIANLLSAQARWEEAEHAYREAIRIRAAELGDEHAWTLTSLNNLGTFLTDRSRYDEAIDVLTRAVEGRRALAGDRPTLDVGYSLNNLGAAYEFAGRFQKAEPLYLESLEIRKVLLDDEHPLVLNVRNNLAGLYLTLGQAEQALEMFDEVIAARRGRKDQPMRLAGLLSNRAVALVRLDRHAEALEPLRESEALIRETLGAEHPMAAYPMQTRGDVQAVLGRTGEAEAIYREAVALRRNGLGPSDPQVAFTLTKLGRFLLDQGRTDDAAIVIIEAHDIREAKLAADHPDRVDGDVTLALLRLAQGDTVEARSLLTDAERAAVAARGRDDRDAVEARQILGEIGG